MAYDVTTLLKDAYTYSTTITVEQKRKVYNLIKDGGKLSLADLIKKLGYKDYRLTMLAVHFLVVDNHIHSISPYDLRAPEDLNKHMVEL